MAIRQLYVVCEGQTEETFCIEVLGPHLRARGAETTPLLLPPRLHAPRADKGGLNSYFPVKKYLRHILQEHNRPEAWITTLFDLYALPSDFPGYHTATHLSCIDRVRDLEASFKADIDALTPNRRFSAHLQLHEYEAMLLSKPQALVSYYPDRASQIAILSTEISGLAPEEINDGPLTAPSKRIIAKIPEYRGQKASAGPLVASDIGLPAIRKACPHFDQWLTDIESRI